MPPFSLPSLAYNPVGLGAFDTIETIPRLIVTAGATLTANQAWVVKVRAPRSLTVSTMLLYITVQSGNVDVGIYDSPDGGTNLNRLASSGAVAVGSANAIQTLTLTAAVTLVTGKDYWLAIAPSDGTAAFGRISSIAAFTTSDLRVGTKATSHPLPSSLTTFGTSSTTPWIAAVGS